MFLHPPPPTPPPSLFLTFVLFWNCQNLAKVAASIEARKEKEANMVPEALGALARDPQQVRCCFLPTRRAPHSRRESTAVRMYTCHVCVGGAWKMDPAHTLCPDS